jgi:hypothetical protein
MTGGRDIKHTRQPLNTFFQQNVEPFQKSSIILSGGVDRPYYYSLGNQSTVPFVRLQGSGGTQKEFTWGETVEVLPGQNVQVESASYMAGDIQIQSGKDASNKPARTTISVKTNPDILSYEDSALTEGAILLGVFPCDCRGARRAYLGCRIGNPFPFSTRVNLIGLNKQHSWVGGVLPGVAAIEPSGKKYEEDIFFPDFSVTSQVPLGYGASFHDSCQPMNLPDYVYWAFVPGGGFRNPDEPQPYFASWFYTLEYL